MKMFRAIALGWMFLSPTMLLAADPFVGKWSLDVKHSKYAAGPSPKLMTIEMSEEEHGVHYHSETVWMNGSTASADYTAEYDGQPVIVMGVKGMMLPVAVKRIKPNEVLATYTRGMRMVAASRRVVSAGGRTMTVTTTTWDESRRVMTNVGVYKRLDSEAKAQRIQDVHEQAFSLAVTPVH